MTHQEEVGQWIETAPGPFGPASMFDVWHAAYCDFRGRDAFGFGIDFMGAVEAHGHLLKPISAGLWLLDLRECHS